MDARTFVGNFIVSQTGKTHADDFLKHYADESYNPEKAHEYYLRTRELKGRQPTQAVSVASKATAKASATPVKQKPVVSAKPKTPPKSAAELQVEANAQVKAIEAKLKQLSQKLAGLKQQQKAASAKKADTKKASEKPHAETQQEKAQAHLTYEKEKAAGKVKKQTGNHHSLAEQIKTVQSQIDSTRKKLDSLVTKLRVEANAKMAKLS